MEPDDIIYKVPDGAELELLTGTFGADWKTKVVEALNVYDLSKDWPAYKRDDKLGIFAAAALKNEIPLIGYGERAKRLDFPFDKHFTSMLLKPTEGIAKYVNDVLQNGGVPPRIWAPEKLMTLFSNFSAEFKQKLIIVVLFSVMVEFYSELSKQWHSWIGNDTLPGKVSPVTTWSNYSFYQLWPLRDDLETLLAMHAEEALNVFFDIGKAKPCSVCSNRALLQCSVCKKTPYCSASCQKSHWIAHREVCRK